MSKTRLYSIIAGLIGLPFIGFLLATFIIAPVYMDAQVKSIRTGYKKTSTELVALKEAHENLQETNEFLQKELTKERDIRAKVEAHITIAESARAEAVSRSQEMEKKLSDKEGELVFYEAFVKPQTERKDLQCFNISADLQKDQLEYGVNFLRADQAAKDKLTSKVRFRVLMGEDVVELNEQRELVQPLHTSDLELVKQNRLTGKFKAIVPKEGLRILDIKAYDRSDRIIAHCWKAF